MAAVSTENAILSRHPKTKPPFPPPELWLEIIPHIPYTPSALRHLRLVHPSLNVLIQSHERGLVAAIILHTTIPSHNSNTSIRNLFPQMPLATFPDLRALHIRLYTLDAIERQTTTTHPAFRAGLLLLYRLQDAAFPFSPSDAEVAGAKRALLSSLPPASLACVLFALVAGVRGLREGGPAPMRVMRQRKEWEVGWDDERMQTELACEETLLLWGPRLLFGLLGLGGEGSRGTEWAVGLLKREIDGMDARQAPLPDGRAPPSTLIAVLRRSLAAQTGCPVRACVEKMWEIVSGMEWHGNDEGGVMARVVKG